MTIPNDLVPLPTIPYDERPISMPLDREECRTALWECQGNITRAAAMLKVNSGRLRRFVNSSPYLSEEMREARERLVDVAEDNLAEALTDKDNEVRRDMATRLVLTTIGKGRGWGTGGAVGINIDTPRGKLVISWEDGTEVAGDNARVINGEAAE